METDRFWVVFLDGELLKSRVRHPSRELAKTEARRLANEYKGKRFYVAAVTGYAQIPEDKADWVELKNPYPRVDSDWP